MRQETERRKVYHDSAVKNGLARVVLLALRVLMQVAAGGPSEEGDGVFENGCDDGEAFADGFG